MHTLKRRIMMAMVGIATLVAIIVLTYSDISLRTLVQKAALDQRANFLVNASDALSREMNRLIHPADHLASQVKHAQIDNHNPLIDQDLIAWQGVLSPYVAHLFEAETLNENLQLYFVDASGLPFQKHLYFQDLNSDRYMDAPTLHDTPLTIKEKAYIQSSFNHKKSVWLPLTYKTVSDGSIKASWHFLLPVYKDENQKIPYAAILMSGPVKSTWLSDLTAEIDQTPRLALFEYTNQLIMKTANYPEKERSDYTTINHALDNGWHLTYQIPPKELMSPFNKNRAASWLLAGLFVLLIAILSLRLSDDVESPILQLIHRFNVSNVTTTFPTAPDMPVFETDELRILFRTFENLSNAINLNREKLMRLQSDLEHQADEKSTALRQTNLLLNTSIERLAKQETELETLNHRLKENLRTIDHTRQQLLLTEKNESMKFLVSGVAHELNTPIGNAITLSTYLETEYSETLHLISNAGIKKNRLLDSVHNLTDAAFHLSQNIAQAKDILELIDMIIMTPQGAHTETIYLSTFIDTIFRSMTILDPRPIELRIIDPERLIILTDPAKLSAVLKPLIQNSLDHGFSNQIHPVIQVELSLMEEGLQLTYSDNGTGVAPQNLPHLFTPFFTTKFGNHKGLGLNLAYNVVNFYFLGTMIILSNPRSGLKIQSQLRHIEHVKTDFGGPHEAH